MLILMFVNVLMVCNGLGVGSQCKFVKVLYFIITTEVVGKSSRCVQ